MPVNENEKDTLLFCDVCEEPLESSPYVENGTNMCTACYWADYTRALYDDGYDDNDCDEE